jgi:hypothetical protein
MDELRALGLDLAKPPAELRLNLALHPLPPHHLQLAEAPHRRHRSATAPGGRRQWRRL